MLAAIGNPGIATSVRIEIVKLRGYTEEAQGVSVK